jgi:hypothetical protein
MSCGRCGYYWKLYDGTTPADAVEGGKDAKGVTFYIALVYLKLVNEKLAGMIIPSSQSAYITSFGIAQNVRNDANTEVKILCSAHREAFEWITTKSEHLHLLTNRELVPGGVVLGQSMYIGRVRHDGGVVVGKVFPHNFIFQGLWIPSNGTHFQYLSYEVLAFNPTKLGNGGENSSVDLIIENIFLDL